MSTILKDYNTEEFGENFFKCRNSSQGLIDYKKNYIEYQLDRFQSDSFVSIISLLENNPSLDQSTYDGDDLYARQMLTQEIIKLLNLVNMSYDLGPKNELLLLKLEQVLGRAQVIFDIPIPPLNNDRDTLLKYNKKVDLYNNNLKEMDILARHLSGHDSVVMKYIGIALIIVGVLAIISFIILASIPSLAASFSLALGAAGLIGPGSITAGIIGGVAVSGIGGWCSFYANSKTGLSLSASKLAKTNKIAPHILDSEKKNKPCASGEVSPKTSPASFDGVSDEQPAESIINQDSNSSLSEATSETGELVKPASPEAHNKPYHVQTKDSCPETALISSHLPTLAKDSLSCNKNVTRANSFGYSSIKIYALILMGLNHKEKENNELTADQLKKIHHKNALKYHPDKGGNKEDFVQATKGYEMLKYNDFPKDDEPHDLRIEKLFSLMLSEVLPDLIAKQKKIENGINDLISKLREKVVDVDSYEVLCIKNSNSLN